MCKGGLTARGTGDKKITRRMCINIKKVINYVLVKIMITITSEYEAYT